MAGGLVALFDHVAVIARAAATSLDDVGVLASKATAKAAGVVIDDAAVAPKFVEGVTPARELPIIWRIAKGSLFNKLAIILPIALLLSSFASWALTPLLMLGGLYLAFEGAEKVLHMFTGAQEHVATDVPKDEDSLVKGAVTTDFILSAEIMVISLNEVSDQPVLRQAAVLLVVGALITLAVYGAVGLLVKMDDIGLSMTQRDNDSSQRIGRVLVDGMPKVLSAIGIIGTFAMLWVGGHILLSGVAELGWHWPQDMVHLAIEAVERFGGVVTWVVETFFSLIAGLIVGFVVVGIIHFIPLPTKDSDKNSHKG